MEVNANSRKVQKVKNNKLNLKVKRKQKLKKLTKLKQVQGWNYKI